MIRTFHDLRRDEEGQALVLAAISMLILTLCVLSTINLTYAAKERIRLQNTADAAAYSTAAYQARAMNFFAYTNRAMVVHYASEMNLMAVLSFMSTSLLVATILAEIFSAVPYLNVIFNLIKTLITIYYYILNAEALIACPLLDGINYGLALAQTGVWTAMGARLLGIPGEEVTKSNPKYRVEPLGAFLGNLTLAGLGVNGVVNANPTPNLGGIFVPQDSNAALNRLLMTEMANAARSEWTAKGNGNSIWIAAFIPRTWSFGFSLGVFGLKAGRSARTEWGSIVGGGVGGGTIGSIINALASGALSPTEQLFSLDRFFIRLTIAKYFIEYRVDCVVHADRDLLGIIGSYFGSGKANIRWEQNWDDNIKGILSIIAKPMKSLLEGVVKGALSEVELPKLPLFHFGQTPYARFIPQGKVGASAARSGLFNQPPVFLMVTAPASAINAGGQPFAGRFGFRLGGLSAATRANDGYYSDATRNKTPSKRGYVDSVDFRSGNQDFTGTEAGFHAVSAAMAYYHRPGDWREPPNLFNPFWGAKLMPVMDYPTMQSNPLLSNFFTNNLVVH